MNQIPQICNHCEHPDFKEKYADNPDAQTR